MKKICLSSTDFLDTVIKQSSETCLRVASVLMVVDNMFYVDFPHALKGGNYRTLDVALLSAWSLFQLKERGSSVRILFDACLKFSGRWVKISSDNVSNESKY